MIGAAPSQKKTTTRKILASKFIRVSFWIALLFAISSLAILWGGVILLQPLVQKQDVNDQVNLSVGEVSNKDGVVVLLFHDDIGEGMLHTFRETFPSWKLFLLHSIDIFIVLSVDFPLDIYNFSEEVGLSNGFEVDEMLVYQLENSSIYIKGGENVYPAPVDPDTRFHCNGLSKDKGNSRFYVEGNAWYTYQLFREHAQFLQKYNFFLKIDYDVYFFKPMFAIIIQAFFRKKNVFIHGGMAYHERCAKNARQISNEYLKKHNMTAKTLQTKAVNSKGKKFMIEIPSSSDLYYGNFVGGVITFFGSDEVLRYAEYLLLRGNYFKTRWTDQVYWHNALGIHLSNFDQRVESLEIYRFKPASTSIPHHGSFVHAKHLEKELLKLYNIALNSKVSLQYTSGYF